MKTNLDIKFTAFISIFVFLFIILIKGELSWNTLWSNISTAATVALAFRWVLYKWVWKWKFLSVLEHFHGVPYLEGNWVGKYDSTGNTNTPFDRLTGDAELEICQPDILTLKFIRRSGESASRSYGENIHRGDDGIVQLRYSYLNEPNATVRPRSPISYGSTILNYSRARKEILSGSYWTDQKTTGTLEFIRKATPMKK